MLETGTICPFPWAFPRDTPPQVAANITDPALCTVTFAQWLGTGHLVLQSVIGIVAFTCLFGMMYRVYHMRTYAHRNNQRFRDHAAAPFMVLATVFNALHALESLDLFAFANVYPPAVWFVLDELLTSSMVVCAIILVDFWIRLVRGVGNGRYGLPPVEKWALIVATVLNYVGFVVAGILTPSEFYLYEIAKSIGGALLGLIFITHASFAVRKLNATLAQNANMTKAAQQLRKKFILFSFILVSGSLALLVNALILFESPSWQWRVVVELQYDGIQVVIRMVFMTMSISSLVIFKPPRSKPLAPAMSNPEDSGGNTQRRLMFSGGGGRDGKQDSNNNNNNNNNNNSKTTAVSKTASVAGGGGEVAVVVAMDSPAEHPET